MNTGRTDVQDGVAVRLIRGKRYSLIHPFDRRKGAIHFERGIPVYIKDQELLAYIKDLSVDVQDDEGTSNIRPLFAVDSFDERKVQATATTKPTRGRPSAAAIAARRGASA
jgi:hypothetical protein